MSATAVLNQDDSSRRAGIEDYAKNGQARSVFSSDTLTWSFTFKVLIHFTPLPSHPEKLRKWELCQYFRWRKETQIQTPDILITFRVWPHRACQSKEASKHAQHVPTPFWKKISPGMRPEHPAVAGCSKWITFLPRTEKTGRFPSPWPVKSNLPDPRTFNRGPKLGLWRSLNPHNCYAKVWSVCLCMHACTRVKNHKDNFHQILYLYDLWKATNPYLYRWREAQSKYFDEAEKQSELSASVQN